MRHRDNKIPVTVLSGYLGSGKTTILNHVLYNKQGLKVALIINDMGEINIDAAMIKQERTISQSDEKVVEMSNGCICCTLREDLLVEVQRIVEERGIDYIIIESSGISEPVPVAQTFSYMDEQLGVDLSKICRLDTMVTVVDAKRFWHDFGSGDSLMDRKESVGEDDDRELADLLLDQIEFCDVLILNKSDLVTAAELKKLTKVLSTLQPEAKIVTTSFGKVDPNQILATGLFDFEKASASAGWLKELTLGYANHTPETEEYGISSFVYVRREPFHSVRFKSFVESMPISIVRAKGIAWCATRNKVALLMSQAGPSTSIEPVSYWVAALPKDQQQEIIRENPSVQDDWDPNYGDRMTRLVFIGIDLDQELITQELDTCLLTESEQMDWDMLEDPFQWHLQEGES